MVTLWKYLPPEAARNSCFDGEWWNSQLELAALAVEISFISMKYLAALGGADTGSDRLEIPRPKALVAVETTVQHRESYVTKNPAEAFRQLRG